MSSMSMEEGERWIGLIKEAVARERKYQDEKWGTVEEHPHPLAEWIDIMFDELSEARRSWLDGNVVDCLREVLQVVSVGIACVEQHGGNAEDCKDLYENPTQYDSFSLCEWMIMIRKYLEYAIDSWLELDEDEMVDYLLTAINSGIVCIAQHGLYERPLF